MKKIFFIIFSLSFLSIIAQTDKEITEIKLETNVDELKRISSIQKERFDENYAIALKYAKIMNWPLTKKEAGGTSLSYLIGVSEDFKPIYIMSVNSGAGITSRANKLYTGGGMGLNLHGENMLAGVWDESKARPDHELFTSRVTIMDAASFNSDHATHVAGTIIGSELFQSGNAKGMAYKARVNSYDWNNDLSEVATAASNGLLISNHSYTAGYGGIYNYSAQQLDQIMVNAPFYLTVFAAGNGGGPTDRLTHYAANKNGLAVAAVNDVLNYTGPSSVVAAGFSSRGPSDDFRIKPDISAKGVNTFSNVASATNAYASYSGTSMAAPSTTGTLLLLQQHYKNLKGVFMRASTLRGLAIHTADEAGSTLGPDITFGWGLINAQKAAQAITNTNTSTAIISENNLNSGITFTQNVVAVGSQPLVVSICWTDPPGTAINTDNVTTPNLINDLDLRVTNGGSTFFPWRINQSNVSGAAQTGDNNRDNIEKIEIQSPLANQTYTISITNKGSLLGGSQRYSLIVTGITNSTNCPNTLAITTNVPSGVDNKQALVSINASNTVSSGATAVYHAGTEVLLSGTSTTGFTASNGSVFRAYIEGCSNTFVARNGNYNREIVENNTIENNDNNKNSLKIYPNPNNGIFEVQLSQETSGNIEIYDLLGKVVLRKDIIGENNLSVDLQNYPNGIYLLRLNTENESTTHKIIKN